MSSDHMWQLMEVAAAAALSAALAWIGRLVQRNHAADAASRKGLGERLGSVEKRLDIEEGRRIGRAETLRELEKGHAK